jgi:hypothetical protein
MKFSLHLRTSSAQYLKKADEIVVEYRDRRAIPDYAKKYPNACIALEVTPDTQWDFDEIKDYFILAREKLILCLPDMRDERIALLKEAGIPFFWGYTITTFEELKALIAVGASQVRIGAPLFFQCDKLKKFDITKRVCANIANEGYLPYFDGVIGSWLRPEDVETYSDTFDIIEFADCKEHKEEALYRIYAEQKHWPGRVDMIISNIDTEAYNRMIPTEFAEARKNCGQRCVSGGACRICYRLLHLANPELIREYQEAMENKTEENEQA